MNIVLKTLLFFNYLDIFCGCCKYNNKNEKNLEINNDNDDNQDEKPPVDDNKDKKPPINNKNITRRPSYFSWSKGNCEFQVFCLTFIMIFRDNQEGLKLLEDSNISFFQKVASMVKNYINYKKTGTKGDTLKELQEIYKEYCRFLVKESLKECEQALTIFNDNESNLDILYEIYYYSSKKDKYDKNLIDIVENITNIIKKFDSLISKISYFADNYNLETAKNYNLNIETNYKFINDLWVDNMENFEKIKIFCTYYKNYFAKDLLKTIENTKKYGFSFYIYFIFDLLKKYIPDIKYNEKFKCLDFNSNNNDINENTIFIKLQCCLGDNIDISKKIWSDHGNCIYKDIDDKYWYAYGYNEEFLIDENLIKQKKFKEIVANNFGTYKYTLDKINGFINIKI